MAIYSLHNSNLYCLLTQDKDETDALARLVLQYWARFSGSVSSCSPRQNNTSLGPAV